MVQTDPTERARTLASLTDAQRAAVEQALTGGGNGAKRVYAARRAAGICARCSQPIAPEAPIWQARCPVGDGFWHAPVCATCAPAAITWPPLDRWTARPCAGCERPVYQQRYTPAVYCSERCRWQVANQARRVDRERHRQKRCAMCRNPFAATRRDSRYCSPACRQRAYRQRRGAEERR
jgi:hypothetical protein